MTKVIFRNAKFFENAREGTEKLEPEVKAGESGKTNCTASA